MMGRTGRARQALGTLATAAAVALGSSACASDESPAEAVPEISSRLDRVDDAIEAEKYGQAREAVRALVKETEDAREAGAISDDQAERILQAARILLARLPEEGSDDLPTPEDGLPTDLVEPDPETDQPNPPPADDGGDDGGDNGGQNGGEDGGENEGEGNDEKKDKDDKQDKGGKSDGKDD